MSIFKRPASILFTSAALAAATGICAAPAFAAAKTWTISPGGAITAKAASATLEDTTTSTSLGCTSSAVKGTLKSGSGLAGAAAGSLTGFGLSGCSADGTAVTIKPGHLPWSLNLVSYNATSGVTTATITGFHLAISVAALGCTAEVDGTAASAHDGTIKVTYSDKTHKLKTLTTGGNLHLYDVSSSCLGVVNSGDSATISATYTVHPAQTITSP
jgi:hypothetical protein